MLNAFYFDRLIASLEVLEQKIQSLSYADGGEAANALLAIRTLVNSTREVSMPAEHIWEREIAQIIEWQDQQGEEFKIKQREFTYLDEWAIRYEGAKRRISHKLENGYTIQLTPPT